MTRTDPDGYAVARRIDAPAATVGRALGTLDGLAAWWTPLVDGDPATGGELRFRFDDLPERIRMHVDEAAPDRVRWTCVEHTGHPEWVGTRIAFTIEDVADGVWLRLRHEGLVPTLTCFEVCESGWKRFVDSIAAYAQTGHGDPFR